jgi:hypothetical protein
LVRRERELRSGRWTYRLFPKRQPSSINSIMECPCLMCSNDARCGAFGAVSPIACVSLNDWVAVLVKDQLDPSGDG